ncbi:M15 family metallopeptidase [Pararoseomonas sp. SCSIO 73927]|uniref:M15 family metallopeptidase n=1 Tax=Pararoseomonas sp. SCSIO 73927 TaxID=3114537 RepID=UPI0030D49BEA
MPDWPRSSTTDLVAFYGAPDADADGEADARWERDNIIAIPAPWTMVAAWDPKLPIRKIRVHWRVAESLQRVFASILSGYGGSTDRIIAARLHLYGGAYNFRLIRGGSSLSMHAYGAAIDLDPERNGLGKPWKPDSGMMARPVVEAFKAEGWVWGGDWENRPDAMHFQAAR